MAKSQAAIPVLFRSLAKYSRTFRIQVGPVKASGVPALLVGVSGLIFVGGVARALTKVGDRLPETMHEVRGVAEALRSQPRHRLNP